MTDTQEQATPTAADLDAKVAHLSYEEARAKLVEIVSRLEQGNTCLLYTSPSPRDLSTSRMPSSA